MKSRQIIDRGPASRYDVVALYSMMKLGVKELVQLCIYCWGHSLLYTFSGSVAVWMLLSGNLQHSTLSRVLQSDPRHFFFRIIPHSSYIVDSTVTHARRLRTTVTKAEFHRRLYRPAHPMSDASVIQYSDDVIAYRGSTHTRCAAPSRASSTTSLSRKSLRLLPDVSSALPVLAETLLVIAGCS